MHNEILETSFFYDIPNVFICLLSVLMVYRWAKLPTYIALILAAHCLIPFFLNDVLLPASYFGDQFRYQSTVSEIRAGIPATEFGTVLNASWMLSAIPLPLNETISSIGFFNKFIFIVLFGFLYKNKVLTTFSTHFYLLYPSFALYSGLTLRDMLITASMLIATYAALRRNFLLLFVALTPLWFIKIQNLMILTPLILFAILNIYQKGLSFRNFVIMALCINIALTMLFPLYRNELNNYRFAFAVEDGLETDNIDSIDSINEFVAMSATSGIDFLIKPMPWQAENALQLIQSFENIVITLMLVFISVRRLKISAKHVLPWVFLLLFSLSIYGLIVYNFGSAARYRFPFIMLYVFALCYTFKDKLATEK